MSERESKAKEGNALHKSWRLEKGGGFIMSADEVQRKSSSGRASFSMHSKLEPSEIGWSLKSNLIGLSLLQATAVNFNKREAFTGYGLSNNVLILQRAKNIIVQHPRSCTYLLDHCPWSRHKPTQQEIYPLPSLEGGR